MTPIDAHAWAILKIATHARTVCTRPSLEGLGTRLERPQLRIVSKNGTCTYWVCVCVYVQ